MRRFHLIQWAGSNGYVSLCGRLLERWNPRALPQGIWDGEGFVPRCRVCDQTYTLRTLQGCTIQEAPVEEITFQLDHPLRYAVRRALMRWGITR